MVELTEILVWRLWHRATRRVGQLAAELAEAPSAEREAILAEMEFEQWRAEYCASCR